MIRPEQLRSVVGEVFDTAPNDINADFALTTGRVRSSAGRGILAAAIRRRLGVYAPAAFSAATYGQLESSICGVGGRAAPPGGPPPDTEAATPTAGTAALVAGAVGLDIELVASLPDADDFWASDFYMSHFTREEIAYCMRQPEPRVHFTARWCAKEALAKCDPRFARADPTTVQIVLDVDGRPCFERVGAGGGERLPHAVSLTHTPLMAAAIVIAAATAAGGS